MISLSRCSGEISNIKIAGEDEWIAWLRSQKLQFHYQLPIFLSDGEGTTYSSPSGHDIRYTSLREHSLLPVDHSGLIAMRGPTSSPLLPRIRTSSTIAYGGHSLLPADHSGLIAVRGPTSSPLFTTNQVQCWREHTSSPLSTTLSTCLLVTQNLASYSVKSLPPG